MGKGLHTIQDHNAHTFQRNGKTVNTWSYAKERFYIDKKTGAVIAGKYPQYINKKFMNSLENSGKDYLGKVVHKFTADNKNVTFNNKKNVWVWTVSYTHLTNTKGQILNITDISGTKIVFYYSNDKLVKVEDIKNNSVIQTVSYVYNEDNLIKVVYPGGMENHYEYTDNRLTRISSSGKDSQGKIKECDIAYYTSGQYEGMVQSVTDTIDVTTAYTYRCV